jgi:hypothetical protein
VCVVCICFYCVLEGWRGIGLSSLLGGFELVVCLLCFFSGEMLCRLGLIWVVIREGERVSVWFVITGKGGGDKRGGLGGGCTISISPLTWRMEKWIIWGSGKFVASSTRKDSRKEKGASHLVFGNWMLVCGVFWLRVFFGGGI